jgi:class 3 adenylate cyclase/predicted ATPase
MDIADWLKGLGLERYTGAFRDAEIEADVLSDLTEADLESLGLPLGPRRRILKAAAALAAHPPPAPPPADAAERRQLTVMFCDLVGSTALSARLDPEDMRKVIRAYQDAVSGVVARYDGFVAKFMGDGVLAYFGFPRAHEDDATRAVHAGLEIAGVVAGLKTPARETLAARAGIATGLVVVGDIIGDGPAREQAVVGDTPNLAARLQGLADAGGVVIAAATRRLVGETFRFREMGRHAVKGLAEPVEAFAALGLSGSESRFEASRTSRLAGFVGRETEAAELLARQRRAWEGHGQIVLISGEAGIGKSRLSAWLAERIAEIPHTRLRYQGSPYHRDSALYPFARQFERAAGFAAQEPPEAKLEKLEAVLGVASDRVLEIAPLIAAMLSIPTGNRYPPRNLSPAQQRRQTMFALLDQLEGLARRQPVLMLFEDAQWADATSLEALDLAIERIRKLPVLLIVTHRPEFEPQWKGLPGVTEVTLQKLDRLEAESLVERVTGGRELPPEVLARILDKTDGVPLFVEELTKTILESGLLIEGAGSLRSDGPPPPLAIPSTLRDSLMARLDRLADAKEIAQTGAAIGREFSYALLHAVAGRDEPALLSALRRLEDSELVFRSGEPPAARYAFKHALVRDAAYESLLKSRRQILHREIAERLREKFPEIVEAEPELLAHHFTQAGLTEPAIEYWGKAGDLALRRSAFKEAIAHLGKAIEMTEGGSGEQMCEAPATGTASARLKLQTNFGQAVMWSKGFAVEETKTALARAGELAAEAGDAGKSLDNRYGLTLNSLFRGDIRTAQDSAEGFLTETETRALRTESTYAHGAVGLVSIVKGDFTKARAHFEQTLRIYDPVRDREAKFRFGSDSSAASTAFLALAVWCLGDVTRARELIDEALARSIDSGNVPTLVHSYNVRAVLEIVRNDAAAVRRASEAGRALSQEHGLRFWETWAGVHMAWTRAKLDDRNAGAAELGEALASLAKQGNKFHFPFYHGLLAEVEAEGRPSEAALVGIEKALSLAGETGQHWFDSALHRIRGSILLAQNPAEPAPAEAAFLKAIEIARAQKARSFELGAALALAKLYQSIARDADAHAALGPALQGFSPTPEFPEIAEAKGLFEALGETPAIKAAAAARARDVRLNLALGNAMMQARGFAAPETAAAFARARELSAGGETPDRQAIAYGQWMACLTRGDLPGMREHAARLLADVAGDPDSIGAAVAHRLDGITHWYAGEFVEARESLDRALTLFKPERGSDPAFPFGGDGAGMLVYRAFVLWALGDADGARQSVEQMLARLDALSHRGSLAMGLMIVAAFEVMRGDPERAAPHIRALMKAVADLDLEALKVASRWLGNWALWRSGERGATRERMREANSRTDLAIGGPFMPLAAITIAEADLEAGDHASALSVIDAVIAKNETLGRLNFQAEAFRARGAILLAQNSAAAEAAFLRAIEIARAQKARSFELRAALALAKLYRSTGRDAGAQAALGPALEGFSPTPEFPEIAEASELLAKLAAPAEAPPAAAEPDLAGDAAEQSALLSGLWAGAHLRGELEKMREFAGALTQLGEARPASVAAALAHRETGATALYAGDFGEARRHLEQSVAILESARDAGPASPYPHDMIVAAGAGLARALWPLGEIDRARATLDLMLARAVEAGHPGASAHARFMAAMFEWARRDFAAAEPHAQALTRLARDHDLEPWKAFGLFLEGWLASRAGRRETALARMRRGVETLDAKGIAAHMGPIRAALAEAEAAAGDIDAALATLDAAIAQSDRTGQRGYDSELHRLRGDIGAVRDRRAAKAAFLAAVTIARDQKAKSFELRAALSMAKLRSGFEARIAVERALEGFTPTAAMPEMAEALAWLGEMRAARG